MTAHKDKTRQEYPLETGKIRSVAASADPPPMSTGSERFIFVCTHQQRCGAHSAHAPAEQATRRFLFELLVRHTKDNTVVAKEK
jgi:hypothetical protein